MAVASLLLAGLTVSLIYAMRCLSQFRAYHTVQQQSTLALLALSDDLGVSNSAAMVLGTADSCILPSPYRPRVQPDWKTFAYSSSSLAFRSWVCYYRTANGDLHRAETDMGGSYVVSAIPVASRPVLGVFTGLVGLENRVVARHLGEFKVDSSATAATVQLTVSVAVQVNSTRKTELKSVSLVRVRNYRVITSVG